MKNRIEEIAKKYNVEIEVRYKIIEDVWYGAVISDIPLQNITVKRARNYDMLLDIIELNLKGGNSND